ncbi:MAG: FtsX-like permease family protein [Pseudomonadota bacterium]
MKLTDFRVGWRLLLKEKGAWVVLAGLAVGLAACFLLLGFVRYCYTYNDHLADSARIVVVKEKRNMLPRPDWRPRAPAALGAVALAASPGAAITRARSVEVAARIQERLAPLTLRVVDPNYLSFFGLKTVAGDPSALSRPAALVLSQSMAKSLFPGNSALGAVVRISGAAFEVRAIIEDVPGNTTIAADILLGHGSYPWNVDSKPADEWNKAVALYIKLAPGAGRAGLSKLLEEAVARNRDARFPAAWRTKVQNGRLTEIAVVGLSEMYFDEDLLNSRGGENYGSRAAVLGLAALAGIILLLAGVNYINMVAVQCGQRQREIGIRLALGASRAHLARQFMAESMVVGAVASAGAMVLAWLAAPLFAELVNRPLAGMLAPSLLAGAVACALLLAAVAGLYPALLAMRMSARAALQGRAGADAPRALLTRRILSGVQFAVAGALCAVTLAVGWQAKYASSVNPGFDPAPILLVSPPGKPESAAARAFRADLARIDGVQGVAGMSEAVGRDDTTIVSSIRRQDGSLAAIEIKEVGASFFELYRIAALHGRLFQPSRDRAESKSLVLNALAARELGFDTAAAAVGAQLGDQGVVIGIAPELRYRTLRQSPEPMMYQLDEDQPLLAVVTRRDRVAVEQQIAALWARHFPDDVARIESAASIFEDNYRQERRLGKILAAASVVAIVLAAFGVYVLAAFSVQRRAREIVLRKIHGATAANIARMMSRELAILAGCGGLAGMIVAWFAIESYLAPFVERAPMGHIPLVLSMLCVLLVGFAATARHTVRAMRMLPADALRS